MAEILVYEKGFNHQEIEFTFEGPTRDKLYVLQTRDMNQIETKNGSVLRIPGYYNHLCWGQE